VLANLAALYGDQGRNDDAERLKRGALNPDLWSR
jgi:hypothetical protein